MNLRTWTVALALFFTLAGGQAALAQNKGAFGSLEAPAEDVVRAKALAWYKEAVKGDAVRLQDFDNVWRATERAVLDRLADTFALGNPAAAQLLRDAREPASPAPTDLPAILTDAKQPAFFRANLALAYARSLSNRRVHEEALALLKGIKAEEVVDPNAYLFHRAVCEHALLLKPDAGKTITRLLQDGVDSPERFRTVGALMLLDMQTWKDKDLAAIARKMDNIERRLDLARGGPQTQKIQKEVIMRLDELIKELENQAQNKKPGEGQGKPGDGPPKPGNQPGANNPQNPLDESAIINQGGSGRVDQAQIRKIAKGWGAMSEQERARALQEVENMTRGLSLTHQEQFREYFRRLAELDVQKR